MALNVEWLKKLVQPYVKAQCMTFEDFDKVFDARMRLDRQVQDEVARALRSLGIELVDQLPFADEEGEDDAVPDDEADAAAADDAAIPPDAMIDPALLKLSNEMLCIRFQAGDRAALAALWKNNYRLVYKYARLFWKNHPRGPSVDDLAMAGVVGFLRAAQRFDDNQGRFTTYAVFWVRQSMHRCYEDEGTLIRLPVHMHEKLNKVMRLDRECEQAGESDPGARRVMIARRLAEGQPDETWTPEKVDEILSLRALVAPTSLDLPVGAEEDTSLGDFLPDVKTKSVEDQVLHADAQAFIEELFDALTPREIEVLRQRFGLGDGRARTLEEVGELLGVTRERIRQIESKALRKLRRRAKRLGQQDYLEG